MAGALIAALVVVAGVQAAPQVRAALSGEPVASAAALASKSAVNKKKLSGFAIRGSVAEPLVPGKTVTVNLRVASREAKPVWVTRLKMYAKLDARSAARGCSIERDYLLMQLPQRAMPIQLNPQRLRKGKRRITRWTIQSDVLTRGRPAIQMRNLGNVNQNACKGAVLSLSFLGRATNRKPPRSRATGGTLPQHQSSNLGVPR